MYTIKLGSFLLNGQILLLFAFALAGWAALRSYERTMKWGDHLGATSFQVFLTWLITWKGSLILWEPESVIRQPLSLIYFDGGVRGQWVAALSVAGYILYLIFKGRLSFQNAVEASTIYLFGGLTVYNLGLSWFKEEERFLLLAVSVSCFLMVLSFLFVKGKMVWSGILERWLWFCISLVAIRFLNPDRRFILLSFDSIQLACVAAVVVLYVIVSLLKRRNS